MRKFNVDNVEARFIKNILLNTYLPNFPIVSKGDFIVDGAYYVFRDSIIKCTASGILATDGDSVDGLVYVKTTTTDAAGNRVSKLVPACCNLAVCSTDFLCGVGIRGAGFKVINRFITDKHTAGITSNFVPHSSGYDNDTHRNLGKYLRWYKSFYGVDLMPLYNCFTNTHTTHIHLSPSKVEDGEDINSTVWIVPAYLNKSYKIFVKSPSTVLVKGVFLNDVGRVRLSKETYLDTLLEDEVILTNSSSYRNPITFNTFTTNKQLLSHSNNFYIAIQVPNNHDESIVVIEGDVMSNPVKAITSREVYLHRRDKTWMDVDYDNFNPPIYSSLTKISTKYHIPYSDRLLEYLSEYAIFSDESISQNIQRVQSQLGILGEYSLDKDAWSTTLKFLLYNNHFRYTDNRYVNKINIKDSEIPHTLDNNKVFLKDANGNFKRDEEGNKILIGLKNMKPRMSHSVKTDILGYCDKDIENSLYKYKDV